MNAPRRWLDRGRIRLPADDPGVPDTRSPARLLLWVGRHQLLTIAAGISFGIVWMVAQALMPYAIGQAIQQGVVEGENDALVRFWARSCSPRSASYRQPRA